MRIHRIKKNQNRPNSFAAGIFRRYKNSNKYRNGHCLVIGGSRDYSGAPYLAARAAFRTGCGIVTLAVPEILREIMQVKCTEELILPLPEIDGYISHQAVKTCLDYISKKRVSSIVIGPGLSGSSETARFVKGLLPLLSDLPVVVDADAIFNFRDFNIEKIPLGDLVAKHNLIITPHEGELSKFLDVPVAKIYAERKKYAWLAAKKINGCCVLKGHNTIVTDGKNTKYDRSGTPVLSTAGSGDVLSGILGSLFAQAVSKGNEKCKVTQQCHPEAPAEGSQFQSIKEKYSSDLNMLEVAFMGVKIHSAAGNLAVKKRKIGVIASDIIEEIPSAAIG